MATPSSDERSILIVDDEFIVRDSLSKWFRQDGYRVEAAEDAAHALKCMERGPWDAILLDIKMPGVSGLELQKQLKEIDGSAIIIMITAYASVESAVHALKGGAFDYITKPVDPDHLSHVLQNALRQKNLSDENVRLRQHLSSLLSAEEPVGDSVQLKKVMELARTVAKTDTTVMIRGESGTGKELIALTIHARVEGDAFFPLSLSIAALYPRACSRASCSDMRRERSPGPNIGVRASSRWPTVAQSFSMRWVNFRFPFRNPFFASFRNTGFDPSGISRK